MLRVLSSQASTASLAASSDFLSSIRIEHGPADLLGGFILKAVAAAEIAGLTVELGTFDELNELNAANRDSWKPLLPVFDHRLGSIDTSSDFCVFGRDRWGEVAVCHAARLYSWPGTTFYDELSSLRLYYADPERQRLPGERCEVTAQSTRLIGGRVVFSGAAWIRPDHRKTGLHNVFPRLGKALAFAKWGPDSIVSFMTEEIHARGMAPRFGYTNVDWAIDWATPIFGGHIRLAFLSMSADDCIDYIARYHSGAAAKVDRRVGAWSA